MTTTFSFYIDKKHTVWERVKFDIEAETEEEAIEKAKEVYNNDSLVQDYNPDYETLSETMVCIDPSENGGHSTKELFNEPRGETLMTNGKEEN